MKEKNIHQLESWIQTQKHIVETTKALLEKCNTILETENEDINTNFLENAITSLCERIKEIQQYQICINSLANTIPHIPKKTETTIDLFYEDIQTIKNDINLLLLKMDICTEKTGKQIQYTSSFKKQLTKKN